MGFRKDFFPALLQEPDWESLPLSHESKHSDCVFLCSVKGRELLMKYSGYSKDRKRLPSHEPLTRSKLQSMLRFVEKDSKALCDLILSLQEGTNPNTAPHPLWKLFTELVRNSPVCGIPFSTSEMKRWSIAWERLQMVSSDSTNHNKLDLLQRHSCSSLSFGLTLKRRGTPSLQLSELSSQRSQNAWQSPILYLHLQQVTIFQFKRIS